MFKYALLVSVVLLLTGCMLQSAEPLIPDSQSELVLGAGPSIFSPYSLHDGVWTKEDGQFTFTAEGNHYRATDGKSEVVFSFRTISGNLWALQSEEEGKLTNYLLAEKQDNDIQMLPLDCKTLRDAGNFAAMVEFKGDDCLVIPGIDAGRLFATLAKLPFPKELKLVREPIN